MPLCFCASHMSLGIFTLKGAPSRFKTWKTLAQLNEYDEDKASGKVEKMQIEMQMRIKWDDITTERENKPNQNKGEHYDSSRNLYETSEAEGEILEEKRSGELRRSCRAAGCWMLNWGCYITILGENSREWEKLETDWKSQRRKNIIRAE